MVSHKNYSFLFEHKCALSESHAGLPRLPPNAPLIARLTLWIRKCISPNPDLAITKRNFRNKSQSNAEARRHGSSKFCYIIHPYSSFEFYRELIFLVIALWGVITTPLISSFCWVSEVHSELLPQMNVELVHESQCIGIMQGIWLLSCFFTGYKYKQGQAQTIIELNQWKIVKRYILTYFIVDLVALSVPFQRHNSGILFYWLNFVVVFRCPTIISYSKRFLQDLGLPEQVITCLILMMSSTLFVHMLSCVFYLVPIMNYDIRQPLWVTETNLQPNCSVGVIYFGVFCLVQSHFWGLGETSVRVENNMEEFVLTIVMIVGRVWSLFVVATMLRVFTISSLSESKYEQYILQLRTFIWHNNLPKEMEDRLLEYLFDNKTIVLSGTGFSRFYEYTYQRQFFNEKAIISAMSQYLREELTLFRAKSVINKVHIFKFFPRSMIAEIIGKCKILVFMNNDYVKKRGELMDHVYFISTGTVAVFNEDRCELIHLTDGDEMGIRSVTSFLDVYFDYTYVSIETTEMYMIPTKELREIVYSKQDILKFFRKKVEERAEQWVRIQTIATTQGTDLWSELQHQKVLEHPRIRTRFFDYQ